MELEIRGRHLPGRTWSIDGEPCHNVHVGIQIRREPADLVRADAERATWLIHVDVTSTAGTLDFRGPAVQGRRGERFVYLTWGDLAEDGTFRMFRRAKLMLNHIDPGTITAASRPGRRLVASVDLTDERGGPRCARLRAPALAVDVE